MYGGALHGAVDALADGSAAIARAVVAGLSAEGATAAIWAFDPMSRELICVQASLADLRDRRLALGVGVAGWVASHQMPATVTDLRTDRRGDHFPGDDRVSPTGVAVPVPSNQHYTGGVLEVYGPAQRSVSDADVVAMGRLAAVIAAGAAKGPLQPNPNTPQQDSRLELDSQNIRMLAELHDGVSQRLASLSFYLSAATAALAESSQNEPVHFAIHQLTVARELAELAAADVRSAITGLRPPVLDDLGLARAVTSLCAAIGAEHLTVEVDVEDAGPPVVGSAAALALYRVAQEALANATKHAGVATVRVRLHRRGSTVVLDVRDDGAGFLQGSVGASAVDGTEREGGLGHRNMAERMAAVGGRLELWSAPGRGTHVRAIIPSQAI